MAYYITLQSTYEQVELALCSDGSVKRKISLPKTQASSHILVAFDQLLKEHSLTLPDLTFLAVNQGPAPFTTLRVVIATANGLSFASHIPLVGVDGLTAYLQEQSPHKNSMTVAVLNAFHHDVYYGIATASALETGCNNGEQFLTNLAQRYPTTSITFIGNAARSYETKITELFGTHARILSLSEYCSIEAISQIGWVQWQAQQNIVQQLKPLYLKMTEYNKVNV